MGKQAPNREVGRYRLDKYERKILREHEHEQDQKDRACICRIFSQRQNANKNVYIEVCENYVGFKSPDLKGVPKNLDDKRGKITGFSKDARRRQIKDFASLKEYPRVWQDFTFPDELMEGKTVTERSAFSSMCLKRLKRYMEKKGISGRWKREWERRKSGRLEGELCPHFHVLWEHSAVTQENFRSWCIQIGLEWVQIGGAIEDQADALAVTLKEESYRWLNSKKAAQCYVSKYMAKVQLNLGESLGRFWGKIGELQVGKKILHQLNYHEGVWIRRMLSRMVRSLKPDQSAEQRKRIKACRRGIQAGKGFVLVSRQTVSELMAWINSRLCPPVLDCPF